MGCPAHATAREIVTDIAACSLSCSRPLNHGGNHLAQLTIGVMVLRVWWSPLSEPGKPIAIRAAITHDIVDEFDYD